MSQRIVNYLSLPPEGGLFILKNHQPPLDINGEVVYTVIMNNLIKVPICQVCGELDPNKFHHHKSLCRKCSKREYSVHQRSYYREWYKRNGRNRADNYIEAILEWRQEHPDRVRVANNLRYAVKAGKILKPLACESCGREVRLGGHHEDYSKTFEVIWLCSSCHKIKHPIIP